MKSWKRAIHRSSFFFLLSMFIFFAIDTGPSHAKSLDRPSLTSSLDQTSPPGAILPQASDFQWEGAWKLYTTLSVNTIESMSIVRLANGTYSVEFLPPSPTDKDTWHPKPELIEQVDASESTLHYSIKNVYQGTVLSITQVRFERTENPDQLRGSISSVSDHQWSGNQYGWTIVDNHFDFGTHAFCAARNNAAFPSPCMATGQPYQPQSQAAPVAPRATAAAAPTPETRTSQTEIQPTKEILTVPDTVAPPSASYNLSTNMVSPLGQAGAAFGTTALLATWLVMEYLGASQSAGGTQPSGNGSSAIVDSLMNATDTVTPAEAGDLLAEHTAAYLENLDQASATGPKPVAPDKTGSPPALSADQASPGGATRGATGESRTEIFDGQDAYTILQALQLVPTDVSPNGELRVDRENLDQFLHSHPDGKPHRITLPNGNEVVVSQIQGIAFEDGEHSASDESLIDFTRGIAILADVVAPGGSSDAPVQSLSQAAGAGRPGSANSQAPSQASQTVQAEAGEPQAETPNAEPDRGHESQTAEQPDSQQPSDAVSGQFQANQGIADGHGAQQLPASETSAGEESELDRFFESAGNQAPRGPEPGPSGSSAGQGPVGGGNSVPESTELPSSVDPDHIQVTPQSIESSREEVLAALNDPSTSESVKQILRKELAIYDRALGRSEGPDLSQTAHSGPITGSDDGTIEANLIDGDEASSAAEGF
jgi:hypothetical protein